MLRKLICLLLCLALVALTACKPTIPPAADPAPATDAPAATQAPAESPAEATPAPEATEAPAETEDAFDAALVSDLLMQTENFSFALLQNLKNAYTEENTLFSPVAFNAALAALYAAADGDTAEELRVLMGCQTEPEDTVKAMEYLLSTLDAGHFSVLNSLHLTNRLAFAQSYLDTVAAPLSLSTETLNFGDVSTFTTLNKTAEVLSSGHVTDLLTATAAADTLYVLSGFALSGAFDQPFEAQTAAGSFESPTGLINAQMMHGEFTVNYAEDEYMQLVSLPMNEGRLQLKLILPREDGQAAFDEAMIQYAESWLSPETAAQQAVSLTLPAFTLSSGASYVETLSTMGLNKALRAQTVDFTAMLDPALVLPTPIRDLYSVAAINVSPAGLNLRDAAVEAVPAQPSEESVELVFDRPFLTAVTDTQTGAILAIGWVNQVGTGR